MTEPPLVSPLFVGLIFATAILAALYVLPVVLAWASNLIDRWRARRRKL